jgi:hypothetical protein
MTGGDADPVPPAALPAGCSRRGGSRTAARRRLILPSSLDERTVARVRRRDRDDAVQEAWLAYLRKRNPNTAIAAYVNLRRRQEARCTCFSDLDPDRLDAILSELAG